jgi:hypothetical protein
MVRLRLPALAFILLGLLAGPAFAGRATIDPDGTPVVDSSTDGRATIDPDG